MNLMKPKSCLKRRPTKFLVLWVMCWVLAFVLSLPTSGLVENVTNSYTSIFPLGFAMSLVCFAFLQRALLRRYLQIDARRWVSWTLLGVVISVLCYAAYDSLIVAPLDPVYFVVSGDVPDHWDHLAFEGYQILPFIIMLGVPIFFQLFALPKHFSSRWLWIIAAFASGSLWYTSWEGGGVLFKALPLLDGLFTRETAINLVWPFSIVEVLATPVMVPGILLVWMSRQAKRREDEAQLDVHKTKSVTPSSPS